MQQQKVIFLKGLQGSGKTTWAKKFIEENPKYIRVNKDDIRAMFSQKWSQTLESIVYNAEYQLVKAALKQGFSVVIDNTGFNQSTENKYRELAWENASDFDLKEFNTPLEECIERDSKRENPVGEKVIRAFYNKNIKPFLTTKTDN